MVDQSTAKGVVSEKAEFIKQWGTSSAILVMGCASQHLEDRREIPTGDVNG